MTQKDKELLLNDLCCRLTYGVKIHILSWNEDMMEFEDKVDELYSINKDEYIRTINEDYEFEINDIKPYLFPLSSMTEEQCYKLASIRSGFQDCWKYIKTPIPLSICNFEQIEWFHKNHFDYRGLIEKGLAIDCTNLNIY